jgi:hypothetical protein
MLIDELRAAATAVIELAQRKGLGIELPQLPYTVHWMEAQAPGSWSGREQARSVPSFFHLHRALGSDLDADGRYRAYQAAAKEFDDARAKPLPAFWISGRTSEVLLRQYFERVGSLRLDEGILAEVTAICIADLESPTASVRTVWTIEHFSAEEAFELSAGIWFRPVSPDDIDLPYRRMAGIPETLFSIAGRNHPLHSDGWVCEYERRVPKDSALEESNSRHSFVEELAGALNLAKTGRSLFRVIDNGLVSPYLAIGVTGGGGHIASSGIGDNVNLTGEDIDRFRAAFRAVRAMHTDDRFKSLRLPFRRLRSAAARRENEDRFVDYVIGLERLLAPDTPNLETTFRFRLRGAALLPPRFGSSRDRIKLMSELYSLRSRVVHGGDYDADLRKVLPIAEDVLRSILLWYMNLAEFTGNLDTVLRQLDEALVYGGSGWSQDRVR